MELKEIKYIHFTGIKGIAMTSLALCAQDLGIKITGTDTNEIFVTDEILKERNIKWEVGFKSEFDIKPDLLITTGAHNGLKNPEVIKAKNKKVPVITQGEALSLFSKDKLLVSVCGVGGKTTVSSMIAFLLDKNKLNPAYAIGVGKIFPLGYGGKYTQGSKYFVCEADEFAVSPGVDDRPKFALLKPNIVVVTNIEHDHPDIYPTIKETKKAYLDFINRIPEEGLLVINIDNKNSREILNKINVKNIVTYGYSNDADWKILEDQTQNQVNKVVFVDSQNVRHTINLKVPGDYNAMNAIASLIVSQFVGIDINKAISSISEFEGTQRRFQKIGLSKSNNLIYDDYAHHPEEIKKLLKAAKSWFPDKKIIGIFQPHTYSRTEALFEDFKKCFIGFDKLLLMDIYASAREKDNHSVSSLVLSKEISKLMQNVYYSGSHEKTIDTINKLDIRDSVILTIGAGNIFYLDKDLLKI
jgi:UDP-N-acetylmuramate--alanine ligase